MMNQIATAYKKHQQAVNYLFFGVATTIVNWAVYSVMVKGLGIDITASNIASWIAAVAFAFVTNKLWVFKSKARQMSAVASEAVSFVGTRLLSGVFEIGMLPVLMEIGFRQQLFGIDGFVAKILVSIVVVILNYVLSKFFVFTGGKNGTGNIFKKVYDGAMRFDGKSLRNKRISYYAVFAVLFSITSLLVFSWFITYEKSFIWNSDGLEQHYNSLMYYGMYLREIIKDFFAHGTLTIPMWDHSIGYGGDIITTMHYYVLGDPLTLLSVAVPTTGTETLYNCLVLLRLFLAGCAFSAYCHRMGKGRFATLCGAIAYAFCGFALFTGARHPYFINPMIYLPFLLIGVEKIFAKQKPYLFIVFVFISAISNFYFFYMLSLLVVIYAMIRFFFIVKQNRIKNLFVYLGKFISHYLIGILMAGVIILPNVIALLSSHRIGADHAVDLFYPIQYYQKFISSVITSISPGAFTYMGYTALALAALVLMFHKRKKHTQLKIGFVLLTIFLLLPYVGHVLNGFSYVSNRWIFGYSFLVTFILTSMMSDLFAAGKKQLLVLIGFSVIYFAVCFSMINNRIPDFFAGFIFLLLGVILFAIVYYLRKHTNYYNAKIKSFVKISVLVLIIANIFTQASYLYPSHSYNYIGQFKDVGLSFELLNQSSVNAIKELNDKDSFYRYEENRYGGQIALRNTALRTGLHNTSYYFSMSNSYISRYMLDISNDLGLTGDSAYTGSDNRAALNTLANSKYFVIKKGLTRYLPYGYNKVESTYINRETFTVYKNDYALPFGYTYSDYISREKFERFAPLQKQQAMLQGAVIDESHAGLLPEKQAVFSSKEIPFEISCNGGVEYKDGKFIVKRQFSKATVRFSGLKNCETYLSVKNLHYTPVNPRDNYTDDHWESLNRYDQIRIEAKYKYWRPQESGLIRIRSEGINKSIDVATPSWTWYIGKHDFLVNLCYREKETKELTLTFEEMGEYSFDQMQVLCQPMDDYPAQVEALKQDVLEDVKFDTDSVSGTIRLTEPKLLCLTIPYSKGWTATVNGKATELIDTNSMYTGIVLGKGEHNIVLTYATPGIKIGVVCTGAGAVVFLLLLIFMRKKKDKKA